MTCSFHSDENFAKLFRNKNIKQNKVLELAIEDLHLICLPYNASTQQPANATEGCALDCNITAPLTNLDHQDTASITTAFSTLEDEVEGGKDVISVFNIVIATVSGSLMKKIYPNYAYKCQQMKFTSIPGEDPVAAAMGLRQYTYGLCRESLKRYLFVLLFCSWEVDVIFYFLLFN